MTWNECREWADAAASDFIMLDPSDLPAMAHFVKRLEAQSEEMEALSADHASTLKHAAVRLKGVILKDEADPDGAMQEISATIESLQCAAQQAGQGAEGAPSDEPTGVVEETPADDDSGTAPPPWVDDTIVAAYVEQQAHALPEMEERVLAFEKLRAPELLGDLRRLIHTLKGESGVVGALHIEKVCHRLEDYLDGPIDGVAPDVLFAALDWLNKSAQVFGSDTPPEDPTDLLKQLTPPAPTSTPPPAQEPTPSVVDAPPEKPKTDRKSVPIADHDLALDFTIEAQEHFDAADEHLLVLEREPDNADAISAVFRAFHTIKGVAGFLGLPPLGAMAHAAETLLDEVRKGKRVFTEDVVEVTFNALDALKVMVHDLGDAVKADTDFFVRPEQETVLAALESVLSNAVAEDAPPAAIPDSVEAAPEPAPDPSAANESVTEPSPAAAEDTGPEESAKEPSGGAAAASTRGGGQTMKIEAARIDLLLDTIGELVIAEAVVSGNPEIQQLESTDVERSLALLGKITRSLRDMGMSMRLVPVDPVFKKMARLVRDLAKKSGKKVEFVMEGGETEIDKGIVEKLGDPLVHMIRNSMDHGLETVEERQHTGKPEVGRIVLKARHQGGNIHIDIEDDGRGLNRDAIVAKAVERGIITDDKGLSDQDVYALIFQPGFSTAKEVTEISGRGVGMDVVRRNIESLRGNILIRSTPGEGSVFTLALPLTTAIIDGMLTQVGEETYILPTLSILESLRPAPETVHTVSGKGEVFSFRGNLLPIFRLSQLLDVNGGKTNPSEAIVMVVEEFGKQWGFMVDEILGQQQVVIKNIGEGLDVVPGIAGASILANGRPGLILDIAGLIRRATDTDDTVGATR